MLEGIGAKRPENLSGTHGEPALHTEPVKIQVKIPSSMCVFDDEPVEVFITSQSVILWCETRGTKLAIKYPQITLHAVSSDPHALYLQIEDDELGHEFMLENSEYDGGMFEVFLLPQSQDPRDVNRMFAALSTCASMHPDPASEDKELDDSMMSFEQQMNDPNHKWITADDIAGQFDDAEDQIPGHNGHVNEEDLPEGPRKWRRTS